MKTKIKSEYGKAKIHKHPNAGSNGFKKGTSGNPYGRPKTKRKELRKLLKELKQEYVDRSVTPLMKKMIYDIYSIALSDHHIDSMTSLHTSSNHLYFLRSDMLGGIKIGVSKDVQKRIKQIKSYAPDVSLIKYIPFCGEFEMKIHKKYNRINLNKKGIGIEWFKNNDDLINWIEKTNSINDLIDEFGGKATRSISIQTKLF